MKTTRIGNEDLFVIFRGTKNTWHFKFLLTPTNPATAYYFTNTPEEIRHVLRELSFEEAVLLAHRLKPESDSDVEILDCIKPVKEHLTLSRGNPPRVS